MAKDMDAWGVTTDMRGHLFICDHENDCVQMFSTDGKYMGALLKKQLGFGKPREILWCESSSCFVVAHETRDYYNVSVLKIL